MATNKRLSQGVRKFIRKEKARLRREALSKEDFVKRVEELHSRYRK